MSSPHIVALPSLLLCKHVRREPQAYTYTHSLKNDLFFLTKCSLAAFIAIRGIKGYRMSNQKIKRRDGVGVQVIDQLLHPQSGSRGLSTRAMTRRLRASIHVFASSFRLSIIWLAVAACYTGVPLLPEHPPSQSNYRTPTRAGKSDWATASGAADSAIVILLTARQVSA